MTQRRQVVVRLLDGDRIVGRHSGVAEVLDGRVEQHHRQSTFAQALVVLMCGVGLTVLAAGEDDAGHMLVEQHVDVVGLGQAAGRSGAQHGRESTLSQGTADDLSHRRKDRVLQLR